MTYLFDPTYWNGTIFLLNEETWQMKDGWMEFRIDNKRIPASYFPKSLTFDEATAALPDMFHTNRNLIVFSERARLVMEDRAPGQVEFIPAAVHAERRVAARLEFDTAYYFINVLGCAQRLQWLEMPTRQFATQEDGVERFGSFPDFHYWKLRERAVGEPLIWHDNPWIIGNKRYSNHPTIFIEDTLWREFDAIFPDQLNAQQVGVDDISSTRLCRQNNG